MWSSIFGETHSYSLLVVVVLRSPIHANEPSEYNGMLYRTSNRVLNNGIKVIILICMDGTSQYHHHLFAGRVHWSSVGKLFCWPWSMIAYLTIQSAKVKSKSALFFKYFQVGGLMVWIGLLYCEHHWSLYRDQCVEISGEQRVTTRRV